jgi:hypothetical protein
MFLKRSTEFLSKNQFYVLIAVSVIIHSLAISLSPQAKHLISQLGIRNSSVRAPGGDIVEIELVDNTPPEAKKADTSSKKDEEQGKKEEAKKYKIFTDTSDITADEDNKEDSDKIGEKAAVAKDLFPDDGKPVNNKPHAEGRSQAPLLGKGGATSPSNERQQPQKEENKPQPEQAEGNASKNIPPRFANLPKGISQPQQTGSPNKPQPPRPQAPTVKPAEAIAEMEEAALDAVSSPEKPPQTPGRARMVIGQEIEDEEVMETLPNDDAVFITKERAGIEKIPKEPEEKPAPPSQEIKTEEKKMAKAEKPREVMKEMNAPPVKVEPPARTSELPGYEPSRKEERGLDEDDSPGETAKPKVFFNVNAKTDGAGKDPVLFEDTISNAAIPGAPTFNVKKHEYADYFKHIRDRISLYWFLGYGTRAEIKLETKDDKPIIIEFKVYPNGAIDDVKIVDDAGNFNLASRLISSVEKASPINPFPPKIKEPSIDVRFNFYFF